ncbi:MAG TPA: VIT domain-containing protein [Candidatus Acidoferrum sp.]|nr:VIT domain-containing protein [Candidatus Acidoferrum sp.]
MKRWTLLAALLGLVGTITSARAAGLIIIEDTQVVHGPVHPQPIRPPFPRPFPPPRPYAFAPLDVDYVKVHTRITDQVAVTSVDQEFYNPNPARLEGTFVFPVPKGAHLDKFTMEIDGRQVEAELLPADKARHIYEDIVRRLKDPALLEYGGRDVFKVRIFPIEPNSRKRIKLSYTELLKADNGLVSYVLPLDTEKYSAKPIRNVSVKVDLQTQRPLKSIYSPSHAVEVRRDGANRATAGYEASDVQPNADFALYFAPEKDEIGLNLLTHRRSGEDGYFLLLASPGMDVKENRVVMKDVAIVLDTSGSMAGKKLEQAKKALQFCVENLNDGDRFQAMRFSTEVEPLFDDLAEATRANRTRAEDFIKDLKAIGGTAIDDALKQTLALARHRSHSLDDNGLRPTSDGRPFVVIFLTDGCPTVGTVDEDQIVANVKRESQGRTRVFCFGIGTDVNTHLLDRIAEDTRAASQYVLPEEDIEIKVSSFFAKISQPVLANPTLKATGDIRLKMLYPSPLPDLFKGEQLVLVGRYSGKGDCAVVIEGNVNGTEKKYAYDAKFPGESEDCDFIPRLWATRRVGYLLDEIRLHGESAELRDEATDLARQYGIVTPYTAYLIMEDERRHNVPLAMQSFQGADKDGMVRRQAAAAWGDFKSEREGNRAVGGALSSQVLKNAMAAQPAASSGNFESRRALGLPAAGAPLTETSAADRGKETLVQYAQQAQFVAGRNFFLNNNQWTDSEVQKQQNAKRVRIQFGSAEYFHLATNNPAVLPWLALGQNVQFVYNGTFYDVYE